jgi:hypothetical protein
MQFTPVSLQSIPKRSIPNITPADHEIAKVENYLSVVMPADNQVINRVIQEDLVMTAVKLAQYSENTSLYLTEQAIAYDVTYLLPSDAEADEYWKTNESVKKVILHSFVRSNHQLTDRQVIYIEVKASRLW